MKAKYTEMAEEAAQRGCSTRLRPIEIGARGFMARSAISLLSELGVCGQSLRPRLHQGKTQIFPCGLASLHQKPVFNHRKRLFLKTLGKVEILECVVMSTERNWVLGSHASHYAPENA